MKLLLASSRLLLCGSLSLSFGMSATAGEPPETEGRPVAEVYHGVKVVEDYRWLEDLDDPAVLSWTEKQNAYARRHLDGLPHLAGLRSRLQQILNTEIVSYRDLTARGDSLFAIRHRPPREQPVLVLLPILDDPSKARVIVDPNDLGDGGTTGIDWYVPSPDGLLVAVSLSDDGSESGALHIFATDTGRRIEETIPRVNGGTTGGDVAWLPDGSGFFYTRCPRPGERPTADLDFFQQIYFHRLGTAPAEDRYELGKEFPRTAEVRLEMDHRSGRLLASVQYGDSGRFAHYLRSLEGSWRPISRFGDGVIHAFFGSAGDLFLLSRNRAPRGKILRASRHHLDPSRAEVLIAEGEDSIHFNFWQPPSLLATSNRLYVVYQLGGPAEVRVFDHSGRHLATPALPPVSAAGQLVPWTNDDILFASTSYLRPETWHRFHAETSTSRPIALTDAPPVDFSDVEVVREFAVSRDGTRVPLSILRPRGTRRDGSNPCLVTGYGGFGASITPNFDPARKVLLDHGILFVRANLRGGGEFGVDWHQAGHLTHKQNVFDDFAAVLQHLVDRGYTTPAKIAITGGSNGGLLMGATLVQHPDMIKAVVAHVGLYDMLRFELSPNGEFNLPEYGTVEDPEQFTALHAYSPYHNVRDGTPYPAALFLTGANDPRVDPMHSRKMVARLQAATSQTAPILLRASAHSGHESSTLSHHVAQSVDVHAFLFDQLGISVIPSPDAREID